MSISGRRSAASGGTASFTESGSSAAQAQSRHRRSSVRQNRTFFIAVTPTGPRQRGTAAGTPRWPPQHRQSPARRRGRLAGIPAQVGACPTDQGDADCFQQRLKQLLRQLTPGGGLFPEIPELTQRLQQQGDRHAADSQDKQQRQLSPAAAQQHRQQGPQQAQCRQSQYRIHASQGEQGLYQVEQVTDLLHQHHQHHDQARQRGHHGLLLPAASHQ